MTHLHRFLPGFEELRGAREIIKMPVGISKLSLAIDFKATFIDFKFMDVVSLSRLLTKFV